MEIAIVTVCALAVVAASYFTATHVFKTKKSGARAVKANLLVFAILSVFLFSIGMGVSAASDETSADTTAVGASVSAEPEETTAEAEQQTQSSSNSNQGIAFIASALAVGLAGIGGGIAVAAGAPAAIGATSEDPANFGKALIFVALGEGIAIYGLLISFLIYSAASSM